MGEKILGLFVSTFKCTKSTDSSYKNKMSFTTSQVNLDDSMIQRCENVRQGR